MKVAIVGAGLIGQKRARCLPSGSVRWIVDPVVERAEALAAQLVAANEGGERPKVSSRWQDALAAGVDVAFVATPHDQLATIGLACVENGVNTLLEKPGARSLEDLMAVQRASQATKSCVRVGYNHRFHPGVGKAIAMCKAGRLGDLFFVRARYGHGGRIGYGSEWRFSRAVSGGGQSIDQMTHLVDLSQLLLGSLKVEHASLPNYFWGGEVEDNAFMALSGASRRIAWLHAGWTEWKNLFSFEVAGRDGKLQIDGLGGSYGTERLTHYHMLPEMGPPETSAWEYPRADGSWEAETAAFFRAIAGEETINATLEDSIGVLKVVQDAQSQT